MDVSSIENYNITLGLFALIISGFGNRSAKELEDYISTDPDVIMEMEPVKLFQSIADVLSGAA